MDKVGIVPEKSQSSLDRLADEIDQDPAFQRVVQGVPRQKGFGKGNELCIGKARFVPCDKAREIVLGIEAYIGRDETEEFVRWRSGLTDSKSRNYYSVADNAAFAVLLHYFGREDLAKKIMGSVHRYHKDGWFTWNLPDDKKYRLMTFENERGQQYADVFANAWLALAYAVLPLGKADEDIAQQIVGGIVHKIGCVVRVEGAHAVLRSKLGVATGGTFEQDTNYLELSAVLPLMWHNAPEAKSLVNDLLQTPEYANTVVIPESASGEVLLKFNATAVHPGLGTNALCSVLNYVCGHNEIAGEMLARVERYFPRIEFAPGVALRHSATVLATDTKSTFVTFENIVYALACMAREGAKQGEVKKNV